MHNKRLMPILIVITSVFSLSSCNMKIAEGAFTFKANKKTNEAALVKYDSDDLVIEIPETVDGIPVTKIARKAFVKKNAFNKVVVSKNLKVIEKNAFADCANFNKLDIQKAGNIEIKCNMELNEIYASDCSTWLELSIPKNVELRKQNSELYLNNQPVINLDIKTKTTKIRDYAFYGSRSLERVNIPNNIEGIETNAFAFSPKLKDVTFSSGSHLEYLNERAFYNCDSLVSISLPSGLKEIKNSVFDSCDSLTSIFIPKSVEFIDSYAFWGCNNLTIYCEHESEPSSWDYDWNRHDRPVIWGSSGINS